MRNLFILIGIGAVVLLFLFTSLPAVCGSGTEKVAYENYVSSLPAGCEPVPLECFEQAMEEGQLNMFEWAEWWPQEMYDGFSKEFGIKVVRDYFGSEDEVIAKFKLNPEAGYDYVYTGLRAAVLLREMGALREINYDWVPNVKKYLPEWVIEEGIAFGDPGWKYAIPYEMCITSYCYNEKYVDDPRIPSWSVLFEPDEKYKGRITLTDNMWEVIPCALIYLGYRIDTKDEGELMEVRNLLLRLKPYIMAFDSWPVRLMVEEEAYISHTWGGDALYFHRQLESIRGVLPAESTQLAFGTFGSAKGGAHPAVFHLWANYVFRPEVNNQLIETIGYSPLHTGVPELLSEEMKAWSATVLPEEYVEKSQFQPPVVFTKEIIDLWEPIWLELKK